MMTIKQLVQAIPVVKFRFCNFLGRHNADKARKTAIPLIVITTFQPISRYNPGNATGPWSLWNVNRKSYPIDPRQFRRPWV